MKFDREGKLIEMRWKTDHFEDLKLRIFPNDNESWLYIVAPFQSFDDVDESKKAKFAYDMLKASWQANGVKFAIEDNEKIVVIAETNDTDITPDELRVLVGHVVHACDVLYQIYPS
ncbi:MAG: hypothetical protein ACW99U_12385 [Candidatus Thorarchaeota archaeon]|jgi:hypothetical protein